MKTLYLECSMGAAGDMLSAALYELLTEKEKAEFIHKINALGLSDVSVSAEPATSCGINGTHFCVKINGTEEVSEDVHEHHHHEHHHEHEHGHEHHHHEHEHEHEHHHHHSHSSLNDIEDIINSLEVDEAVKKDALSVYMLIAEAESHAHGKPVSEIHFHEVGTKDAICDIVSVCMLIHILSPDTVKASPVHVGSGHVRCAHGILPVPAPATAHILKGVPIYGGNVQGELCTPTGAALLKHFVSEFGNMPVMQTESIGYGMGKKEFEYANCVRAFIGEEKTDNDKMYEIRCNVDDMTAEAISFATSKLLTVCNDVYTIPVGMKKNRQGVLICALCSAENKDSAIAMMLRHTSTIGVRETEITRHILEREITTVETNYGKVRIKNSHNDEIRRSKFEFDDISEIADKNNMSIEEIMNTIRIL